MRERPLHIAHVVATAVGAPWLVGLARAQKRRGHQVTVILPSLDGTIPPQLIPDGIECHALETNILSSATLAPRARMVLDLARLLRRLRPDVVHGHILSTAATARLAAWLADVPIRFTSNAGPVTLESDALRAIEIGTAFCDTRTIASCTYTRELFHRYGIPKKKTALVYYPSEQDAFDPALADGARVRREIGIAPETPVVGIVAHFYPPLSSRVYHPQYLLGRGIKGHEVLIDAIPAVLREVPQTRFVLVGRGWGEAGEEYRRSLVAQAERLGVTDAILFTGARDDIPDVLASFDISVHPSLCDNLGGTLESLLMERPMIVSDIPGYRDTILPEQTGVVVPMGDATALAGAIVKLLRDPDRGRRLGVKGRQHVREHFTLAHSVSAIEELLSDEKARAEGRYRLVVSAWRALLMPFRIAPILRTLRGLIAAEQRRLMPPVVRTPRFLRTRELFRSAARPLTRTPLRFLSPSPRAAAQGEESRSVDGSLAMKSPPASDSLATADTQAASSVMSPPPSENRIRGFLRSAARPLTRTPLRSVSPSPRAAAQGEGWRSVDGSLAMKSPPASDSLATADTQAASSVMSPPPSENRIRGFLRSAARPLTRTPLRSLSPSPRAAAQGAGQQLESVSPPVSRDTVATRVRRLFIHERSPHHVPFRVMAKYRIRKAVKGIQPYAATGRPRIAQVAAIWTDAEWFVNTCVELTARGYDVLAVIDSHQGTIRQRLEAVGIRTTTLPMTFAIRFDRGRWPVYAVRMPIVAARLARILRNERIDLVHSHVFVSVVIARLAATMARTRHVAGITGPRHLEAPLTRRIDRLTWWLDDATVSGCRYVRNLYASLGANEGRLYCIYYAADASRFDPANANPSAIRASLGVPATERLVVLIAHFYPPTRGIQTPARMAGRSIKGQEDFIAAAKIIARGRADVRFVLAGNGITLRGERFRRRLMDECRRDDVLRDRVLFTGHADDVPSLLAAADVAVQSSITENLGGTIEALLMQRPTVATRVGGMPEAIRDGETGLLVPACDPDALATAILRLIEDRDLAATMARRGRELALREFTFAESGRALDELYRTVLARVDS